MFKKFTNGCVKLVQRFLPDAFVFCIILTIVVFIAAMPVTGMGPIQVITALGKWSMEFIAILHADGIGIGTGKRTCKCAFCQKHYHKACWRSEKACRSSWFCFL